MDCAFCAMLENTKKREIIFKNDLSFAFLTYKPIVPGHTLICPIRHVKYFEDLTKDEVQSIFDLRMNIHEALIKTFKAEGFNYAWNENEIGGQSVQHFHLHILPRVAGDAGTYQYEPRQFLYGSGGSAGRKEEPEEELSRISKLIRSNL